MSETKILGIHGGATGDADPLFLQHNVIAIGWVAMGDPGKLKADREEASLQRASPRCSANSPLDESVLRRIW